MRPRQSAYIVPAAASRPGCGSAPPAPPPRPQVSRGGKDGAGRGAGGCPSVGNCREWSRAGAQLPLPPFPRGTPVLGDPRWVGFGRADSGHTRGVQQPEVVAEAPPTAGIPGGEPPPRASVSPAAAAPHRAARGDARAEVAGGRGGLLPGAASGPAEAARGTVNIPPPLFKPLPVVRRAPGVRTCVWAGAGTSLKAPRGPSRSWEGAVAGRGARAAPERVCAGGPSSGSVGPRLGAGSVEGWSGCSIPSSGCGGEGRREGEWRGPPGEGGCSPTFPSLPRVREDAR